MDEDEDEAVAVVSENLPLLPLELIGRIFSYLDVADLARCCVSNEILKSVWVNQTWVRLYLRDFTIARQSSLALVDKLPLGAEHALRLELEEHHSSMRDK